MGSPAPHTPVLYLKGGGSNFFSAKCQTKLIEAFFNPDWFGDYDYVRKNVTGPARAKVRETDDPASLTAEERFLGTCQAGHCVHDASQRQPGAINRGDPCANHDDAAGYIEGRAPTVPMETVTGQPNCVHHAYGREEDADMAVARDPAARRAAQRRRVSGLVARQRERYPQYLDQTQNGTVTGLPGADQAPALGTAAAVGAKDPVEPNCPASSVIDGGTAEECIESWLDKAEDQMRGEGLDAEISKMEKKCGIDSDDPTGSQKRRAVERKLARAEQSGDAEKIRKAQTSLDNLNAKQQTLDCLRAQRSLLGR